MPYKRPVYQLLLPTTQDKKTSGTDDDTLQFDLYFLSYTLDIDFTLTLLASIYRYEEDRSKDFYIVFYF